jgi:hypothetical protein
MMRRCLNIGPAFISADWFFDMILQLGDELAVWSSE